MSSGAILRKMMSAVVKSGRSLVKSVKNSTSVSVSIGAPSEMGGGPAAYATAQVVQIKIPDKYSLRPRSIQKRLEVEQKKHVKRQPKPKQKPAPLSKYRRKTANARERTRMKEINQAFETLRKAIPEPVMAYQSPCSSSCSSSSGSSNEKWTKITTLRLAMNYIEALTQVLDCQSLTESTTDGGHLMDRNSLSSSCCSDLGDYTPSDLLSESSSNLGDPLDTFDDIPNISCINMNMSDAFDIFALDSDADSLNFHSDLSDQPTP